MVQKVDKISQETGKLVFVFYIVTAFQEHKLEVRKLFFSLNDNKKRLSNIFKPTMHVK